MRQFEGDDFRHQGFCKYRCVLILSKITRTSILLILKISHCSVSSFIIGHQVHRRQHTGERPYSCAECRREFTNWANYNKHMKRRHRSDSDPNSINTIRNSNRTYQVWSFIVICLYLIKNIEDEIQNYNLACFLY